MTLYIPSMEEWAICRHWYFALKGNVMWFCENICMCVNILLWGIQHSGSSILRPCQSEICFRACQHIFIKWKRKVHIAAAHTGDFRFIQHRLMEISSQLALLHRSLRLSHQLSWLTARLPVTKKS